MRKIYLGFNLILIFSILSSFSSFSGRKVINRQNKAFIFELMTLSGKQVSLKDYQGKIVVINFWASWSAPSLREMPNLERLQQVYKHTGIQVLGVAVVSKTEDIADKVAQTGVHYPILIGNKELVAQYGSFSDLPTTFILDGEGHILRQLSGSHSFKAFETEILPYLNDPSLTKR